MWRRLNNSKVHLRLLKGLLEARLYSLLSWLTNHHCTKHPRWSGPLGSHQRGHREARDVIQKQPETHLSLLVPSIVLYRVIFKGLSSLRKKRSLVKDAFKNWFITVDWFMNGLFSEYSPHKLCHSGSLFLHEAIFAILRLKRKWGVARRWLHVYCQHVHRVYSEY